MANNYYNTGKDISERINKYANETLPKDKALNSSILKILLALGKPMQDNTINNISKAVKGVGDLVVNPAIENVTSRVNHYTNPVRQFIGGVTGYDGILPTTEELNNSSANPELARLYNILVPSLEGQTNPSNKKFALNADEALFGRDPNPIETPNFKNAPQVTSTNPDMSHVTGISPTPVAKPSQAANSNLISLFSKSSSTNGRQGTGGYAIAPLTIDSSEEANPYDIQQPEREKVDSGQMFGAGMLGVIGNAIAHGLDKNYNNDFKVNEYVDYINKQKDKEYEDALRKIGMEVEKGKWGTTRKDVAWEKGLKQKTAEDDARYKNAYLQVLSGKNDTNSASALKFLMEQNRNADVLSDALTKYAVDNGITPQIAEAIYTSIKTGQMPNDPKYIKLINEHSKSLMRTVYNAKNSDRLRRPVSSDTSGEGLFGWGPEATTVYPEKAE